MIGERYSPKAWGAQPVRQGKTGMVLHERLLRPGQAREGPDNGELSADGGT